MDIKDHVKTIIEVEVVKALNSAPEAVEKLVKAALSKEVDSITGKSDGYSGRRVSYLDYMVGDEIREAARAAVRKVVQEMAVSIEDEVRRGLSGEDMVRALMRSLVRASVDEDWRMTINFEADKKRT